MHGRSGQAQAFNAGNIVYDLRRLDENYQPNFGFRMTAE